MKIDYPKYGGDIGIGGIGGIFKIRSIVVEKVKVKVMVLAETVVKNKALFRWNKKPQI